MTSFLRKFIVGQAEREREKEERSIIFDFTVYVDVVYLGSSRALFSHGKGHIPFVRSLSLFLLLLFLRLFTFVYCSVFNAFAAFRSVCDEKRKGIISSCFLNIHIYTGLVLFSFSPPSSSSSTCIPSTCRDDDRQRRGRSETAYIK